MEKTLVHDFWSFIRENKKWWLIPLLLMFLLLLLTFTIFSYASASGVSPYIYVLF